MTGDDRQVGAGHDLTPHPGVPAPMASLSGERSPFVPRRKANPADVRRHNRSLILQVLFPRERLSRADLARATGLTRVVVSDVVSGLLDEGLVVETGRTRESRPGKPGTLLRLDAEARQIVAVDLSQPAVLRGAITNLLGQTVHRDELTAEVGPAGLDPALVVELCRRLVARADAPLLGIGIASPGTVDADGVVLAASNFGWDHVDLAGLVTGATGVPTGVHNDANSAALAERQFGQGSADMLFVQIARGVGAGVMVDDRIITGAAHAAGEIGHVVIDPQGPACSCGKRGCLETEVSVPALSEAIRREPGRRAEIIRAAAERLGGALAMAVGVLDLPEVVVLGPPATGNDDFLSAAEAAVNLRLRSGLRSRIVVRRSHLGEDIVLAGESAAVLRERIGVI